MSGPLRALAGGAVRLEGGFWGARQLRNRETSLAHGFRMLEGAGNLHDLALAAGRAGGDYRGPLFMDSDLYKWLEAAGYELARQDDPELRQMADHVIEMVAAAQAGDGYLNSWYQATRPAERWTNLKDGHELYCAGHLFEAAVAHLEAGDSRLMEVAGRFAAHIGSVFGPGGRQGKCGHPEIELALIRLYRATGNAAYLDLAAYFLDQRGRPGTDTWGPYYQDHKPLREADEVVGHAVRQLYLCAGAADLYLETGETALLSALERQWADMVGGKLYITGGAGSRHEGEAFGEAFELPNERAYAETCAAIGSMFWSWRMLLATGEPRFADLIERTLYNGLLSGVSLDGTRYCYQNPLLSRGGYERPEWHGCACCPPNVMRLLASVERFVATGDGDGIQLHLPVAATITTGDTRLRVDTEYPWDGDVRVTVETSAPAPWSLSLRVPDWCEGASLQAGGEDRPAPPGYVAVRRAWQVGDTVLLRLPLRPRVVEPHPRLDACRGAVALERGPLVYCLEQADQLRDVLDLSIDPDAEIEDVPLTWLDSAAIGLAARGGTVLTAIPYYAWANRGPGAMRVWIPCGAGK
jgi:DUF1680 family protein